MKGWGSVSGRVGLWGSVSGRVGPWGSVSGRVGPWGSVSERVGQFKWKGQVALYVYVITCVIKSIYVFVQISMLTDNVLCD